MWAVCRQHCLGQGDTELGKLWSSHQRGMLDPTQEWSWDPELSSFIFGSDSNDHEVTFWVFVFSWTKILGANTWTAKLIFCDYFIINFKIFLFNINWLISWHCIVFFRERCAILELKTLKTVDQLTLDQVDWWVKDKARLFLFL